MENSTSYLEWNNKLASHFFRSEMAGRAVHLYVTKELIEELGGGSLDDFVETVKVGPHWLLHSNLGFCQKACHCFQNWRLGRYRDFPPYIAYLGLFVLAAGVEGDFAPHAYYPRLRKLIGETPGGTLPSFHLMLDLWDDLEKWSNQDQHGELGVFNIHIAGSWIHVGLPIAQTLLTEYERKWLPCIFADANLSPVSSPSDVELARLIQSHGKQYMRSRTLNLLTQPKDESDLFELLIETIREELENWDGTVEIPSAEPGVQPKRAYSNLLRLCLKLDRTAGSVMAYLICSLNRDYPEDGLCLKAKHTQEVFICDESIPGWSSPLRSRDSSLMLDASRFDWSNGLELEDERLQWRFRLPCDPIRIFTSGVREDLPNLVEIRQLPRSLNFYIAAKNDCAPQLRQWAVNGCKGFEEIKIRNGLPPGWQIFHIAEAFTDEQVRKVYPNLSFANVVRLSLRNGIRSSQGSTFFDFAAPEVILEGGYGTEKIFCNEQELIFSPKRGAYILPVGLPSDTQLRVQVKRGNDAIKQRSFYLASSFACEWFEPAKLSARFGESVKDSNPEERGVAGAYLKSISFSEYNFRPALHPFGHRCVFLIGPVPGQIASWPAETFPETWAPIWMIAMKKKRGDAIFCGTNVFNSAPAITATPQDQKKLKLWKEILWHWRKRIDPPAHPMLHRLWKQFQEIAKDV